MTDSNYTAIAVLVDRSGSMEFIKRDAQGALNSFVEEQGKIDGKCTIRLSQFDGIYDEVYRSTPVADAPDFVLVPRGNTALNDAWGRLINDFGAELRNMTEDERPQNVLFVVVTDGMENASREFTGAKIKEMVKHQQDKYGWNFVFLAANQDAIATGAGYGLDRGSTLTFNTTRSGLVGTASALNTYATTTRSGVNYAFTDDDRIAAASE